MTETSQRRVEPSSPNSAEPQSGKPTQSQGKSSAETKQGTAANSAPLSDRAAVPRNFGRYKVLKELGRGQMGAVYLAHDTELDRPVALKVVRITSSGAANRLKRMEIEAKTAAKVDHPLICKVYDTGEIDGVRFIALQYVEGEDLKKYLARVGRQRDPQEAVRLVIQILRALSAAHDKQVIHRDIKPDNIMLNKNHEPVIMDFGLARHSIGTSDAGLTQGMIVGTAAYMSPEQATGKSEGIDHRSDLYAVGVMLFEMLTGEWPFTGAAVEVMGQKCVLEPPAPQSLNPNLHPQLSAVCHKLIAKQKENRYATCSEATSALEEIDLEETVLPDYVFDTELDLLNSPTLNPSKSKTTPMPTRTSPPPFRPKSLPKKPGPPPLRITPVVGAKGTSALPRPVISVLGSAAVCLIGLTAGLFYFMAPKTNSSKTPAETTMIAPEETGELASRSAETQPGTHSVDHTNNGQIPAEIDFDSNRAGLSATDANPTGPKAGEFPESAPGLAFVIKPPTETDSPINTDSNDEVMSNEEAAASETLSDNDPASTVDSLIQKAITLVKANQKKEALTPLKRASHLAPNDPRPDFYLGLLNLGWGVQEPKDAKIKLETAEMHFTKALNRTMERTPEKMATANNLALVALKLRKIPAARNYFEIATKQGARPAEINHNLARVLSQPKTFDIKPVELKKIGALKLESANFQPDTGWFFLPLDPSPKMLAEAVVFCPRNSFEDHSCNVCNGCTKLLCIPCSGKGKIAVLGSSAQKTDMGFGMSANSTSMGTSFVVCNACGGNGRVDCRACLDARGRGLIR